MRITFLGSGSAFVPMSENYQSNILFEKTLVETTFSTPAPSTFETDGGIYPTGEETKTYKLLMDAGTHIQESLLSQNIDAIDLDAIFISHLHGDHCHGLEYIGFKRYFIPEFGTNKPKLLLNNEISKKLWDNVLKGTMGSINGSRTELDTYFNVVRIKPRDGFQFANIEFSLIQVPHVIDDYEEVPAFGLKFKDDDIKVFITGDTQFDFWRMIGQYEDADIIFHDCEMIEYPNSVHAQFTQLKELPEQYKQKMWLYHYMLYGKTFEELEKEVLDAGFAGLVKRGQVFDTKLIKDKQK